MPPFRDLAELNKVMRQCHDILRIDKPHVMDAFDEFSKILFAKLQDEVEIRQGAKQRCQFSADFGETAEQIAQKVSILFRVANEKCPEVFEDRNSSIDLRPSTLVKMVNLLSRFSLFDTSIDVKGATYEAFLKSALPVGKVVGQFFTPKEIVDFCISMLDPTTNDIIVDPACGSGGFLIAALCYVWKKLSSHAKLTEEKIRQLLQNLLGVDIDRRMVRLARMNMFIHGNAFAVKEASCPARIVADNGLSYSEKLPELKAGKATIAVTNPPFGSIELDYGILRLFRLGLDKKSRGSPSLFLERCLQLLAPRGKLAIVIPDPILSGSLNYDVRNVIREEAIITAVIKLPSEAFLPYGSSAESSILFLEKKDGSKDQGNVFMAEARYVGYNRVGESSGKNDLPTILSLFRLFQKGEKTRTENPTVFVVSKKELLDRLDVRRYWHPSYDKVMQVLSKSIYPVHQLKEVVTFKNELINPSKDLPNADFRYIGLGNLEPRTGRFIYNETIKGLEIRGSCQKIERGDVIYGKLRPYLRKASFVSDCEIQTVCSPEFIVMKSKENLQAEYLAYLLRSDLVLEQLKHLYTGLGRPRVSKRDLGNVRIPIPELKFQRRIVEISSILEKDAIRSRIEAHDLLKKANAILNESETKIFQILKAAKI